MGVRTRVAAPRWRPGAAAWELACKAGGSGRALARLAWERLWYLDEAEVALPRFGWSLIGERHKGRPQSVASRIEGTGVVRKREVIERRVRQQSGRTLLRRAS